MVDAVSAINAATSPKIEQRKDLTYDWKNMSAREVMEHAEQGDEVPVDVLKWAEDYSKLINAPDDVSYDAVNGSTNPDEVNEAVGETDEPDAEDAAEKMAMTAAQQERQNLVDDNTSLYEQGKIFVGKSVDATKSVEQMEDSAEAGAETGEELAAQAVEKADETVNITRSIRKEYDELLDKVQNDMKSVTPGDLNKIEKLGGQLNKYGMRAQAELANFDLQLQQIDAEFAQYENIPPVATDYGTETVDIGTELVTNKPEKQESINTAAIDNAGDGAAKAALRKTRVNGWRFIFDRNYRMGLKAISSGGNALDAGVNGVSALEEAKDRNQASAGEINGAKSTVEEATFVEGRNVQMQNDENNNSRDNKSSDFSKNSQTKGTDNNGVKDAAMVNADPLEIQKRKERLGLT